VLFTIQIVSKQLHSDNMKIIQPRSIILLNIKCPQLSKPKARQQWQGKKKKNIGRTQAKSGGQFSSGQWRNSDYKTNWIETLREFVHFHLFGSLSTHAGLETRCWVSVPMARTEEHFGVQRLFFYSLGSITEFSFISIWSISFVYELYN